MKDKICRECKFTFEPRNSLQVCCNMACAITYVRKKELAKERKAEKVVKNANSDQKRQFRTSDVPKQLALTQKAFNKLRKLEEVKWFTDRGLEPECISCGKTHMDWCCGHLKTVASSGALRFSEKNTYLQCNKYCNSAKSGNIEGCKNTRGYKVGLVDRFGDEGLEIIEWCESNQSQVKRWTGPELIEMRRQFNKQIRELACYNW